MGDVRPIVIDQATGEERQYNEITDLIPGIIGGEKYESPEQLIIPASPITLAHGLSMVPDLTQVFLINKIPEHGYLVGDIVTIQFAQTGFSDKGCFITKDATNLFIRYGTDAKTFGVLNKNDGTKQEITNIFWRTIFEAIA